MLTNQGLPRDSSSLASKNIYDYWGNRVFTLLLINYTFYFLVRQNFSLALPYLESSLHLDKPQLGAIMTYSLFVFGVGKFASGFILDLSSPKNFLAFGLIGSSAMNVAFSQTSNITLLTVEWVLNALFQSVAWPQCVRLLNEWYSRETIGTRWGILSLGSQLGTMLVFALFPPLIEGYGWRSSFLLPGIGGIIAGIVILFMPLDTPVALGVGSREQRYGIARVVTTEHSPNTFADNTREVFAEIVRNRNLWFVSLAVFFLYIVRTGVSSWAPTYLHQARGMDLKWAGYHMIGYELFAAVGGFSSAWLSDTVFKGRRVEVGLLYFVASIIFLFGLWLAPLAGFVGEALLFAGLGFALVGPQLMASQAALDFTSRKAAIAANGFVGLFSCLGSSVFGGAGVGNIVQYQGWGGYFILLILCSTIGTLFFGKISFERSF